MARWHELSASFAAMGGLNHVRIVGRSRTQLARAQAAVEAEVRRLERRYSFHAPDSELTRLNRRAGATTAIDVDDEKAALLSYAQHLHHISEGRFDVTAGPLSRCWNFKSGQLPSESALNQARAVCGWDRLQWDGRRLCIPVPGMALDLGGIVKEYAADRAVQVLHQHGVQHGYVNLAGDLALAGPQPDGQPWTLGIRHPRQPDALAAELDLGAGALATSGDYERFMEIDGQRYCHLLDARSGWPVDHWHSVSVVAPTCAAAGALATLGFLFGPHAPAFLAHQGARFLCLGSQAPVSNLE